MKNISISKIDVLTNLNHPRIEDIYISGSKEALDKAVDRLSNKVRRGNLKGLIKLSLSVLYFFALVYCSIQLFI